MNLLDALLLGIVQGLTEWLPISSSGQSVLILVNLMNMNADKALSFSFFLHLGSLLAVLVYFRNEFKEMLRMLNLTTLGLGRCSTKAECYLRFLFYSTLVTGVVGLPVYVLLKSFLANVGSKVNVLIGGALIVTGVLLYFSKKYGARYAEDSNLSDMMLTGAVQGVAVMPGISRSGATIAALLFRKFEQKEAMSISYLMAVPAILGANLVNIASGELAVFPAEILVTGVLSSFILSLLGLKFLLGIAPKIRFDIFCIAFGMLAVFFSIYLV